MDERMKSKAQESRRRCLSSVAVVVAVSCVVELLSVLSVVMIGWRCVVLILFLSVYPFERARKNMADDRKGCRVHAAITALNQWMNTKFYQQLLIINNMMQRGKYLCLVRNESC